ncbi:MAG TPA: hypothetical protein VMD74_02875 [Candidatus Methylomirabilis sp.]|nr:hypothetical protein [Candidatus Methylomirabilis sp.]
MKPSMPNNDLYDRVINKINYERRILLLKRKLWAYFTGFLASFILLVPLALKFNEDMASSGTLQFFSLLFFDFRVVAENFGDFSLSILESIPAASSALTILALTALIFSMEKIFRFWREFRSLRRFNKITSHL